MSKINKSFQDDFLLDIGLAVLETYRNDPIGYLYSQAAYRSDASICNSGMEECFYQTFAELVPTVKFYERIEAVRMIDIFKSIVTFFKEIGNSPEGINDLPINFLNDFTLLSKDPFELDELYYKERVKLPGFNKETGRFVNVIGFYRQNYPSDFSLPNI